MAAVVFVDSQFDFLEHPACDAADRIAQGIDGLPGVEVEDIQEILVLEMEVRVVGQSGEHTVSDADCDCSAEGHLDVVYIITLQVAIRNDVEDGLPVVLPVRQSQLICNLLQLILHRSCGLDAKGGFHCQSDGVPVFGIHRPQLGQFQRTAMGAGIGYIEHIPQVGLLPVGDEQGDTLGTTPDIAVLLLTPCVILLTEGGIRPLGMDHYLFRISEAVVPSHGGQERRPMASVGGHLVDGVGRHSGIEFFLGVHVIPPLLKIGIKVKL